MDEFDLIARYFRDIGATSDEALSLGIGDDCAVLRSVPGYELCMSVDTLVQGVHFPENINPYALGWRALAVSLSDVAAMGASPAYFTLALTLESADALWLEQFSSGLDALAKRCQCRLIGGDTTRGPLTISLQVFGWVREGCAISRSGAKVGDRVFVTGSLGEAAAALRFLSVKAEPESFGFHLSSVADSDGGLSPKDYLLSRYFYPEPRIDMSSFLLQHATSAIDVSDGLWADCGHIADASNVCVELDLERLPLSDELVAAIDNYRDQLSCALSGGDDYELILTIPSDADGLEELGLMQIGRIVQGAGVKLKGPEHLISYFSGQNRGFQHFD